MDVPQRIGPKIRPVKERVRELSTMMKGSTAHAVPVLLAVILPPMPHQWNERLFDQTSLSLNASHTIGLRRPPHQLAEPKHVLALESPLTFEIAQYLRETDGGYK
jgi:hypothetical protein